MFMFSGSSTIRAIPQGLQVAESPYNSEEAVDCLEAGQVVSGWILIVKGAAHFLFSSASAFTAAMMSSDSIWQGSSSNRRPRFLHESQALKAVSFWVTPLLPYEHILFWGGRSLCFVCNLVTECLNTR